MTQSSMVLHFSVKHMTCWGQSVVVCGSGALLGNWDLKRALRLSCRHVGEALVWEGQVTMPSKAACEYKYAVVDEHGEAIMEEAEARRIDLAQGIPDHAVVQLLDEWQVRGRKVEGQNI